MKMTVLSLFPEMFEGVFQTSILKQAQERGAVSLETVNFRDYSKDKHNRVDDYPYGGGGGMVLKPQPVFDAVEDICSSDTKKPHVILLCPQGERYSQKKAEELAEEDHLVLICGHYEGYDERIRTELVDEEISIGDFVLTGGEIGAMTIVDSVTRLQPGALGNEHSAVSDSFSTGLLEYPHYTRPANFRHLPVPDVLLSGHHERIETWRHKEALRRTYERRPDLLEERKLTDQEKAWLREFSNET
ncbi:tRNA (guanosine(37)-N1)-methyltransferase TrmD [Texcoconibacillus texcoconensis]|nr:tRNA (guanosine(37)-N1)-methyltransferase TrmD [Texcoconibacillus texcoconensis]